VVAALDVVGAAAEAFVAVVGDAIAVGQAANPGVNRVDVRSALAGGALHVAVGIGVDDDLGAAVLVGIAHDGLLPPRARAAKRREENAAGLALVDPEEALVGVDRLRFAVSFEVEDGRAGARRRGVLRGLHPLDPLVFAAWSGGGLAVQIEHSELGGERG